MVRVGLPLGEVTMKGEANMADKKRPKDRRELGPYVDSYPPLAEWLDKQGARCMWQVPSTPAPEYDPQWRPGFYVEGWLFPGAKIAILVIHDRGMGWEIYTPYDSNAIDATLLDACQRLGLDYIKGAKREGES